MIQDDKDIYRRVAALTALNYDRIRGARARGAMALGLTPAQVSNYFKADPFGWRPLKLLIRWFMSNYINVGDWNEALSILHSLFPDEGWDKLAREPASIIAVKEEIKKQ